MDNSNLTGTLLNIPDLTGTLLDIPDLVPLVQKHIDDLHKSGKCFRDHREINENRKCDGIIRPLCECHFCGIRGSCDFRVSDLYDFGDKYVCKECCNSSNFPTDSFFDEKIIYDVVPCRICSNIYFLEHDLLCVHCFTFQQEENDKCIDCSQKENFFGYQCPDRSSEKEKILAEKCWMCESTSNLNECYHLSLDENQYALEKKLTLCQECFIYFSPSVYIESLS